MLVEIIIRRDNGDVVYQVLGNALETLEVCFSPHGVSDLWSHRRLNKFRYLPHCETLDSLSNAAGVNGESCGVGNATDRPAGGEAA